MNTQYSSLDEVWGGSFPKKHPMTSKSYKAEPKRDPEAEARVFPTPIHRTQHAITTHKKAIDDLSSALPIIEKEEDRETNFAPARVPPTKEHMTNWGTTKKGYHNPYIPTDVGADFPYAPPEFQGEAADIKLNRIMHMIEQNNTGYETPSSQDMLLYIFTGVFFLFTFDTFVNLGRRVR